MSVDRKGVVRVGVRRWDADRPAEPGGPHNSLLGPAWVEIDGVRIPGDVLAQASHGFEPGDDDLDFGTARFSVLCSSYQLVDHETEEPVE